jgi:nucleotide-binding universal stress UspA family protein
MIKIGVPTMKAKSPKKILVLVDGSDRSINTVRYVARNVSFHSMRIVLFHVFSAVPECYWDLENDVRSKKVIKQARAWEMSQRKIIENYMIQAKQLLVKSGIPKELIKTKVQTRKTGIARDIIHEAKNGYAAVVARRRGTGALRGIVLGSVATKLTEKLAFLPLIIVGKKPSGNKILIGFDGSQDAMQAVNFVGSTYGGFDYEVELLIVIRGDEHVLPNMTSEISSKEFSQAVIKNITPSFDIATKQLISSGFNSDSISTKIINRKFSRAKTIADEARQNDFGTIVMGRKGRSRARDFFIGRVTNKVIHMARDCSIWIIR